MTHPLSPRQIAEAIGVGESSVWRWADDGQVKITRTAGGHRRIARNEAIRFIREQATPVVRPELLEMNPSVWISVTAKPPKAWCKELFHSAVTRLEQHRVEVVIGGQVARRTRLLQSRQLHFFGSLSEMAGFAKSMRSQIRENKWAAIERSERTLW